MIQIHPIANDIAPGDLVFDIGAHSGEKSAWFANRGAKVVCVEPQPRMAQIIRQRFAGNPAVNVVQKGVGRRHSIMAMSICSKAPVLSTFSEQWKKGRFVNYVWDQTVPVEIVTLDELIAEFGSPKYCKVDVEGFELEVLSGLTAKAGCISFEFTSEFVDQALKCMDHLASIGYSRFNFSIGEAAAYALKEFAPPDPIVAELRKQASADRELWGDVYAG